MTDREAIEIIEFARAFNNDRTRLMRALDIAVSALQEREERSKGCPFCIDLYGNLLPEKPDRKFCKYCGRRLKTAMPGE